MSGHYRDKKFKFQRIESRLLHYLSKHLQPAAKKHLFRWILIILAAFSVALLTKNFIFSFALVTGQSMEPGLKHGDLVFITKFNNAYSPGDIIAFQIGFSKQTFVKRIASIGPNQTFIEGGIVYVNDRMYSEVLEQPPVLDMGLYWCLYTQKFEVPVGSYFVLGDNRCHSNDSRAFGPIPANQIKGKVQFRILSVPQFLWLTKSFAE